MRDKTTSQRLENLPDIIPVFPLHGVLLLPRGQLPLNIFEKRYLAMVDDAMRSHRIIGMVQPVIRNDEKSLFSTGCAGKITSYSETDDGRYLVTLTGVCRFRIAKEENTGKLYREVVPEWKDFLADMEEEGSFFNLDRPKLLGLLREYFEIHEMTCCWDSLERVPGARLITCLSMICPFDSREKQALLETRDMEDRTSKLITMLEIAVRTGEPGIVTSCN